MRIKNNKDLYVQKYPGMLNNLKIEIPLGMDLYAMKQDAGTPDIIAAGTFLRVNGKQISSLLPYIIKAKHIRWLYDTIADLFKPGPNEILALRVIYSVRGGSLDYLFKGVSFLLKDKGVDANFIKQGKFDIDDESGYYRYDYNSDSGFIEVPDPEMQQVMNEITDYENGMEIVRADVLKFERFLRDVDANSATMSFQEIFCLLFDNGSSAADVDLNVYNAIKKVETFSGRERRHGLLIATAETSPVEIVGVDKFLQPNIATALSTQTLSQMYANLIHLCPPNCGGGGGGGLLFPLE